MEETKRPSRKALYMQIAELISARGTCGRLKVGALVTRDDRIISTGYNGPAPLAPHCSSMCDMDSPCTRSNHAEQNLINFAYWAGINLYGTTLYCTHQPCESCAKLIVDQGIKRVIYLEPYRLIDGLNHLKENGIEVIRITRDGTQIPERV